MNTTIKRFRELFVVERPDRIIQTKSGPRMVMRSELIAELPEIEAFLSTLIPLEEVVRELEETLDDIWTEPDYEDINSYASGNHHGIVEVKQAVKEVITRLKGYQLKKER